MRIDEQGNAVPGAPSAVTPGSSVGGGEQY